MIFVRARSFLVLAVLGLVAPACGGHDLGAELSRTVSPGRRDGLVRFGSGSELKAYLGSIARAQRARGSATAVGAAEPSADAEEAEDAAPASTDGESITNTQEAGVDEGGIVKAHGDHLIVLRRGRLFAIRLADGHTVPRSVVDVSPPGSSQETWYDEMLVSDDTIVVVGYSYGAGATELGLFDFDARSGAIRYRTTYLLRSNDYYSSRNYASRLVGRNLVFYMPYGLPVGQGAEVALPGVRPFRGKADDWDTIIDATRIHRPIQPTEMPFLHTVVTCDLGRRELSCSASGVIGPYGRTFYVSNEAVYVWVTDGAATARPGADGVAAPGVVYRLPLDGGAPGALRVAGVPIDQFSFKEADGRLNVLVRSEGGGDGMWGAEVSAGDVALLRVPVAGFSTRVGTVRAGAYTRLPAPGTGSAVQNRFVGDFVAYGTGSGWGDADAARQQVHLHPFAHEGRTTSIDLPHGVDRIEAMGDGAVVIGTDGKDLHFTSIDLSFARGPAIADRFAQAGASQGELRSHGFFYKPTGDDGGVLGLPVRAEGRPGYEHLVHGSASVLFLAVHQLRFTRLGGLEARPETPDDRCVVSCIDWYGNARPIFHRGRVFALLGYELVEGRLDGSAIREVGRTDFFARLRPQLAR